MKRYINDRRAEEISESFSVAKFLAILLVVTGHYFEGSLLWIPVTIGLFVFSFSSGYFTSERYFGHIAIKKFWAGKFKRLLPPLLIVNIFLLLLFLWQGKDDIFHPHTIMAWVGLSGVLDWLSIKNKSPFGNGLWFLTVLLIFYTVFPLINTICSTKWGAWSFIFCFSLFCVVGYVYASPPYMLWLTVFGFGFGVFTSRVNWHPSRYFAWAIFLSSASIFVFINLCGYRQVNMFFILLMCIAVVAILLSAPLSIKGIWFSPILLSCVLEIYLVHTYLFISPRQFGPAIGYVISVFIIMAVSHTLVKTRKAFSKTDSV